MITAPPTTLSFALYDEQYEFVHDSARFTGFVGGVGSGKTYAGAVKALITMLENPEWKRGVVIAPTYQMLLDATYQTCLGVWHDFIASSVKTPYPNITLKTGQEIMFRSADDPERLRGPNLWWAWLDEAAYAHKNTWTRIIARLRAGGVAGPCWITTTPNQLNWVHDLVRSGYISITYARTEANPYLAQEYIDDLYRQYPAELAKQEMGAEFIRLGAGMIKESKFQPITMDQISHTLRWYRYWDLALTTKVSGDFTASIRCAPLRDGAYVFGQPVLMKEEWPSVRRSITAYLKLEYSTTRAIGIESNAFQLAAIQDLRQTPMGRKVGVYPVNSDRDKLSRALPWMSLLQEDKIYLLIDGKSDWRKWLDIVVQFPEGENDDPVDAMSGAYAMHSHIRGKPRATSTGKQVA